jgi:hypothetical protein
MPTKSPSPNILNIFKGADKQWYWRAKARNGQIIAQSEGYTRRASAVRGAKRAYPDVVIIPA